MKQLKILHVVRHAKSSWDLDSIADIDRTLKEKGIRDAYNISRKLKLNEMIPEKIITSPANRALHTALIFARVFEFPAAMIEISDALYESSTDKMLELIRKTDEKYGSVMICGHNPHATEIANCFLKNRLDNVPTSGVVTLKFKSESWAGIDRKNLEDHLFNFPKKDEE